MKYTDESSSIYKLLEKLKHDLQGQKNNFANLSIHEKRTLIRLLVKKIVWDGRDLHIFMDGE